MNIKILFCFFIIPIVLFAAEVKCPKCNSINNSDDRYCITCCAEMRPQTKEEAKMQTEIKEVDQRNNYLRAIYYFKKAKLNNDVISYEEAYNNSSLALKSELYKSDQKIIMTLNKINKQSEIEIAKLKKVLKKSKSHITLTKLYGTFYLEVIINETTKANLALFEGEIIHISSSLAKKLGIENGTDCTLIDSQGNKVKEKLVSINSIQFQDYKFSNLSAYINPSKNMGDGAIGLKVFRNLILSIDTENKELIVESKN